MSDGIDFTPRPKPVRQRLAVQRFDGDSGRWIECPGVPENVRQATLSCATFNTWFQGGDRELRYSGLQDVLRQANADVIMLQEVTIQLLDALMAADWIRAQYRLARSPFRDDAIPSHGVLLLSRLPLARATLHPLPTHMGRNLLVADSMVNGASISFATVHLESMKSHADTRGEQLREIFAILEDIPDLILAGDFNFCSSSREENSRIDPRYLDIWAVARPEDAGYTQDTEANPMLAKSKGEAKRVRIDRILLRSDVRSWQPGTVELIGTRPVSDRHAKVFPSDHFGVLATICS